MFVKLLSDQEFMIVIHSNLYATTHGFRDNEVFLPTGHDVIVSPPPASIARTFSQRILKERPCFPDSDP